MDDSTDSNRPQDGSAQPPAEIPATASHHLRNHLIWVGPILTFAAAVSYFMFFARFAALRDFPWVNLPLVLLGMILALVSLWRAFDRTSAYRGKILASLGCLLAILVGGMFCWYVFSFSYSVPPPSAVTSNLEIAPEFDLVDQEGRHVRLSDFRGQNVVLTFYRGFW